jgi:GMP synthase (glutamine-hydrolysing)
MRPLLVVKAGTTLPELAARRGDYEAWIAAGMGVAPERVQVASAYAGDALPAPAALAGIVVTGSSAMVSHREPWSERAGAWLAHAARGGTPLLGICYGHQLLAHALGGRVDKNPRGREIGTIEIDLAADARRDPLFEELPPRVRMQATHVESVVELPAGARLLASSARDPHQAFAWGERAWGVQFHPEFDADVIRAYLRARREPILAEGLDADALLRDAGDSPYGGTLLRRFAKLLRE